ncbi:MAG: YecA family protein [Gammaproteobacteria bacterium]|jgi:hypothetical protein
MTHDIFDWDNIESVLQRIGADTNPSELHGTLCGMFCAENEVGRDQWFNNLVPAIEHADLSQRDAADALKQLFDETERQFGDPTCNFQLLLPDTSNSIDSRTRALGDWCQGFVMGMMLRGTKDFSKLPENSAEACNDIVEIARAGSAYEAEDTEEDATALEELIEYVRVGVLLINEELHPTRAAPLSPSEVNNLH